MSNFYPLTIDSLDLNSIVNYSVTSSNLSYDYIVYSTNYVVGTSMIINADNNILFNYSTTFDWGASNLNYYITSMTGPGK